MPDPHEVPVADDRQRGRPQSAQILGAPRQRGARGRRALGEQVLKALGVGSDRGVQAVLPVRRGGDDQPPDRSGAVPPPPARSVRRG
ncbi:hypothetical protein ACIBJF_27780 [Streptomyces sp. NPDC050743]|uniref:hypothetical protein n=1 Tax=Streptomyces sp. NPDC050743 TaxID=3365634 RepID=UPI0037B3EC36